MQRMLSEYNVIMGTHLLRRDLAGVVESPCEPAGPPISKQFHHRYDE